MAKQHGNLAENFADTFLLPHDIVAGATLFHMVGKSNLIIENFKGISLYTSEEIQIKGNGIKYSITGKRLIIEYYSTDDMKITGQINKVMVLDGV
jgi:sporulation protein YqfC